MNSAVNRLLDVDREARALLEEAQAYREQSLRDTEGEKEKLLAFYTDKAQRHLRDLEAEQAQERMEYLEDTRRRTVETLAAMQTRYDENHSAWEQELLRRCLGR